MLHAPLGVDGFLQCSQDGQDKKEYNADTTGQGGCWGSGGAVTTWRAASTFCWYCIAACCDIGCDMFVYDFWNTQAFNLLY